ncbi:MAG: DUF6877 family protein [Sarcina sp.]
MTYFENLITTLMDNKDKINLYVRKDVLSRCMDWLDHGDENDDYIKHQLDYLNRIITKENIKYLN